MARPLWNRAPSPAQKGPTHILAHPDKLVGLQNDGPQGVCRKDSKNRDGAISSQLWTLNETTTMISRGGKPEFSKMIALVLHTTRDAVRTQEDPGKLSQPS